MCSIGWAKAGGNVSNFCARGSGRMLSDRCGSSSYPGPSLETCVMNSVKESLRHIIEQMSDEEAHQMWGSPITSSKHAMFPHLKRLATDPVFKVPGSDVRTFQVVEPIYARALQLLDSWWTIDGDFLLSRCQCMGQALPLESGTRSVQDLFAQNLAISCASLGLIEVIATLARKRKARISTFSRSNRRRKN